MRRLKIFLPLLILLTGKTFGQPSKDTLCFPTETVRVLLISAEQGKMLKGQVSILNERIINLQELVRQTEARDSIQASGLRGQITNLQEQKALYEDQIKGYETLLTKERRKRRMITGAGILTTGAAIFLSLKK